MTTLSTQSSVGQFVAQTPGRARLLEQLGIDYCCGGKRPLADVCTEHNLDADDVCQKLLAYEPSPGDQDRDWNQTTMTELCDHLESEHRTLLQEDLPRLVELSAKVAHAHGEAMPVLRDVAAVVENLRQELVPHMAGEETELFPLVREIEATGCGTDAGAINDPIGSMESEHEAVGALLARLNALTDGYDVNQARCTTHRVLLDALATFERDIHQHVHKENNILFGRVQSMV
jgi:regulator of cell morphogenesis and NO signaling